MIRFLSMVAIFVGATTSSAEETKRPVLLEAELVKSSGPGGRFGPALNVRLVGVAKEAAVTTAGFRVKVTRADKRVTVTLATAEGKDTKGRVVIPGGDQLGIVKLSAGEVAVVRVPSSRASGRGSPEYHQAVEDAAAGEVTLVVEYEVSDLLGKRYGVTSGKFTATATAPR
jgi:hypothetical protein